MKHLLILISILLIITLLGCGKNIPKAGSRITGYEDDTLLVMAIENESGNPINYNIIFEPRNSSGNQYCWIRGRCKNIKHTFVVSGNFEIICCLRPGEYTLKEVNYSRTDRSKYTLGKLKLNEKIKIGYGDLVLLNKKFITKDRLYTSILSTIDKKTIISDLSKIENFNTWKLKSQIGWSSNELTVAEPKPKKKVVQQKIAEPTYKTSVIKPKVIEPKIAIKQVAKTQSNKPRAIIIDTGSLGEISEVRKIILEKTLESKLDDYFAIVPKDMFEEAKEEAFQELEDDECTEDQCVMKIQEILQVENAFKMQLIMDGQDTQISITWNNQEEKRVEEDYCEGCKTKDLRKMISGLVEKLVGGNN